MASDPQTQAALNTSQDFQLLLLDAVSAVAIAAVSRALGELGTLACPHPKASLELITTSWLLKLDTMQCEAYLS